MSATPTFFIFTLAHTKAMLLYVLHKNKKGLCYHKPHLHLSAGKRCLLSNANIADNKQLAKNVFSETDLTRLSDELIKFHEFYKIHFREITTILEKG